MPDPQDEAGERHDDRQANAVWDRYVDLLLSGGEEDIEALQLPPDPPFGL